MQNIEFDKINTLEQKLNALKLNLSNLWKLKTAAPKLLIAALDVIF